MDVQYLHLVSGQDLENMCKSDAKSKLSKYIVKHYVFLDRYKVPTKPGKIAHRKVWEQYEHDMRKVTEARNRVKEVKESGKYILYRDSHYVVSIDNDTFFILSGYNEKEPVSMLDVKASETPKVFSGRHVLEMPNNIYVPFCGKMYTFSLETGYYKSLS